MIRLPNTGTYSLELITAQNGAQSVVSYSDATSSAYTGGTQVASITSATTTTICSTPAASTVRDVDQINIKNTYAGSHTVTVQVDANGTNYPLIVAALLTDESLNYTHGSGWCCLDANGNIKNSPLTSMTSAQLAAIISDETGSGAAVFANGPTLIAPILGTPASGTVTNLTGTASININGTVGATTPAAGTFTTLTSTGNATLGDAEATDTHAIKGATTLLANSASAALTITQTGAGNALVVEDSASPDSSPVVIDANGNVGIGVTPIAGRSFEVSKTITGSTTGIGIQNSGVVQSDVTANVFLVNSALNTAASAFAITAARYYRANQGIIGATSSVVEQIGYLTESTLTGATNNYGFYSGIASAANRWNFYSQGTANNAYAGNSSFGKVTAPTSAVDTTSFGTGVITNTAATYTVLTTDHTIIQTTAASTYTLPAAASFTGRILHLVTQFAGTVTSASSNVVPIAGGAAGTAILAATAGKFATLQSNGTSWITIAAN